MPGFSKQSIIDLLKTRPGHVIVLPKRIYALTHNTEGEDVLVTIDAEDKSFTDMTAEEVNQFIVTKLKH